jgi:nucleoside-diphosphate-sugar epimerase
MMAPALLPSDPLPLDEDSPLRTTPFFGVEDHDNVAMERAIRDAAITARALRPGAIYGKGELLARKWPPVRQIKQGIRKLELPGGGVQFFHRVLVERVGRAIVAAAERAPAGFWACNVVDPYDWTYAGLAREIGRILEWEWEPVAVSFAAARHPFRLASPLIVSDRRLREVLRVTEPDPRDALEATVRWYWEHGPAPGALYADLYAMRRKFNAQTPCAEGPVGVSPWPSQQLSMGFPHKSRGA